ncbi:EAL domain-containing protein [Aminipila butyrica]|uniref:EAL domain-containing protein n=1 Tax=Aminipila butyrica TaxID=433296 RepID=A0A858BWB1_9FIRM|nr:ABC transporter substrate binding protein [Aminipila butyrica]QIB69877.1 EAL domain-containing protein [Aminipila butyrica]
MLKKEKKWEWIILIGAIFLVFALAASIYYFFFYRQAVAPVSQDYLAAKQVLFISSYSESFETLALQKEGIQQAFKGSDIRLDIEYMDMKNYDQAANLQLFYEMLRYKLENGPKYDAILLGDDAALEFAEAHQQELFPQIPMVFFCINDKEHAVKAGENPYITGAVEAMYLKETIDIALTFQPKAKKIIALYDDTLTGEGDRKLFYSLKGRYPGYHFGGLNASSYTLDEIQQRLEALSEDSILIYMSFFEDADKNQYAIKQSVEQLVSYTHIPVYRVSIGGVGEGLIGGKMTSYKNSGYLAASMVMDILKGADVADIPVSTEGEGQYYFDYEVLKKYDIKLSLVPKDAVVINKKITFLQEYREVLIPLLLFVLACLLVLLVVVADNLKHRRLTREAQASHDKLQETCNKLIGAEEKLKQQYDAIKAYNEYLESQKEYIRYQAEHDFLTQLPNRRAAMEKLDQLIKAGEQFAVIVMDIDDFKEINDSYGHACGDEVLKETSRRLLELMSDKLFYASRLGGDEFLLIIKKAKLESDSKILTQIKQIFTKPVVFEEKERYIQSSMGIAYFDEHVADGGEILSNADFAMYAAKNLGKNECVYYNAHMKDEALKRKDIKIIIDEACNQDGFYCVYQPQVNALTGLTEGYEALVRLKDYDIPPNQFISVAEETKAILTIGRLVTKQVVEQMAMWRQHGLELRPVAINFSSKQIKDKTYVQYLKELLEEHQISPELIEIEITESIFMNNNEKAMKLFKDFLSIGVRLALDDFGTGYSSINYLTYIPVSKIKLDKSLVDIYLTPGKDTFIKNIIRLVHCLGLKITVEGVEKKSQYHRLRKFGCDYIQGYYFSQPITGKEVEDLKNPLK